MAAALIQIAAADAMKQGELTACVHALAQVIKERYHGVPAENMLSVCVAHIYCHEHDCSALTFVTMLCHKLLQVCNIFMCM